MVHQRARAAGDEVTGCVAARIDQQQEQEVELAFGEALSVDLGMQQRCCDVIARILRLRATSSVAYANISAPASWRAAADQTGVHDLGQLVKPVAVFSGMPSSSAMTYEGSAPATSVTKSHSPAR